MLCILPCSCSYYHISFRGRVPFKGAYIKISISDISIQLSDKAAAVVVVGVCAVAVTVNFDGILCVVHPFRLALSLGIAVWYLLLGT